jgi:GNAT superfamily N-acetyltransferase
MALATWWQNDPLPELPPLPTFSVRLSDDKQLIAHLAKLPHTEIEHRFQTGNQLYLAYMKGTPVAYGWLATQEGGIRQLKYSFPVAPPNCYLWDFLTLPEWRGQGIYTHFLQEILHQQAPHFDYIWIGYEPGNMAAERAITKAGFQSVADFVLVDGRIAGLKLLTHDEKAHASSIFFNLPIMYDEQA